MHFNSTVSISGTMIKRKTSIFDFFFFAKIDDIENRENITQNTKLMWRGFGCKGGRCDF